MLTMKLFKPCSRVSLLIISVLMLWKPIMAEPQWDIISPLPTHGRITDVDFIDEDTGFLITDAGRLMRSEDGGIHWNEIAFEVISNGPWRCDFLDENIGWILGGASTDEPWLQVIHYTSNGGDNWDTWLLGSEDQTSDLTAIQISTEEYGWAVGSSSSQIGVGAVIYTYDVEDGWESMRLPDSDYITLNDVHFLNQNLGWVVGESGYLARTANGGQDWQVLDAGTHENLHTVSFATVTYGWVAGGAFDDGLILRSTNGGNNWMRQDEHPEIGAVKLVRAISHDRAYAVVEKNQAVDSKVIFTSDGEDWSAVHESQTEYFRTISAIGNTAWVGGDAGYFAMGSENREWESVTSRVNPDQANDIQFLDDEIGWCASDTMLLNTINGGSDWVQVAVGSNMPLFAVHFTDERHGWAGGFPSREFYTDDGGESWQSVDIDEYDIRRIEFSGNHGYAISAWHVASTDDGGDNWTSNRIFPNDIDPMNVNISVPAPEVAFAASSSDSLMMTENGGEDWVNAGLPASGCYGVSFTDIEYGWAVAVRPDLSGRLHTTTNGGDTWREGARFEFEVMGIRFIDRNNGWVWGMSGQLLSSDDGGRTWTDMGLKSSSAIRALHAESEDRFWICGDAGLLARWGEDWQSIDLPGETNPAAFHIEPAWPNPTNGTARIGFSGLPSIETGVNLYDMFGRLLDRQRYAITMVSGSHLEIDLFNLPSGAYYISIGDGKIMTVSTVTLLK